LLANWQRTCGETEEDAAERSAQAGASPAAQGSSAGQAVGVGEVLNVMQELADEGMTSIVVTHELG
jgi:hypothetical protein